MGRRVILQEEVSVDVDDIRIGLMDQARCGLESDAVKSLLWQAVKVIERLLFELEETKKILAEIRGKEVKPNG